MEFIDMENSYLKFTPELFHVCNAEIVTAVCGVPAIYILLHFVTKDNSYENITKEESFQWLVDHDYSKD